MGDEKKFKQMVDVVERSQSGNTAKILGTNAAEIAANSYWYFPSKGREKYLRALVEGSEKIWWAWDALILIARRLEREDKPSPPYLKEWFHDVLDDLLVKDKENKKRLRPIKSGKVPDEVFIKNRRIVGIVQFMVKKNGLEATRSYIRGGTQPSKEGGSACDVVAEAMGMTYSNVAKIWDNRASYTSSELLHSPDLDIMLGRFERITLLALQDLLQKSSYRKTLQ